MEREAAHGLPVREPFTLHEVRARVFSRVLVPCVGVATLPSCQSLLYSRPVRGHAPPLTRRWSEQRAAVRFTFEMASTLSLQALRHPARCRSSWSR